MDEYDVVVAGAGIAGLTAGMLAARLGRSTLVLSGQVPGGHLLNIERIDGVPGFPQGVPGYELCPMAEEHAVESGAVFRATELTELERHNGGWRVGSGEGDVKARAVVLATGSSFRELDVPGEERLRGHGVSDCASCDGPLLRDKVVAVAGGGDSALQEALALTPHVAEVLLFERGDELTAQDVYLREAEANPKITTRCGAVVEEVLGDDRVSGVRVRSLASNSVEDVEVAAIFPFVGLEPNTGMLDGLLELDEYGRVPTDGWMRTELPGLFAAGTLRVDSQCQAASSAGDGATAAKAAHRYLEYGG